MNIVHLDYFQCNGFFRYIVYYINVKIYFAIVPKPLQSAKRR